MVRAIIRFISYIRFSFAGSVGSGAEQVKPQNVGSHRLWVKKRSAQGSAGAAREVAADKRRKPLDQMPGTGYDQRSNAGVCLKDAQAFEIPRAPLLPSTNLGRIS